MEGRGPSCAARSASIALQLNDIAWHSANSEQRTQPVREKPPNPWGLHDMLGNVWEWCGDRAYRDYSAHSSSNSSSNSSSSSSNAVADPRGPATGENRVLRGGSWLGVARRVRAASRYANDPGYRYDTLGLRLAREQGVR